MFGASPSLSGITLSPCSTMLVIFRIALVVWDFAAVVWVRFFLARLTLVVSVGRVRKVCSISMPRLELFEEQCAEYKEGAVG